MKIVILEAVAVVGTFGACLCALALETAPIPAAIGCLVTGGAAAFCKYVQYLEEVRAEKTWRWDDDWE